MSTAPSAAVCAAAARWYVRLHEAGDEAAALRADWQRWLADAPEHRTAWSRIEAMQQQLMRLPADLALPALAACDRSRRRALKALSAALLLGPAAWLAARHPRLRALHADARTGVGERRSLMLADGSRLALNSATALDVDYDAHARRIRLYRGEVWVQTGAEPDARPFFVEVPQGRVQALGTRFAVRVWDAESASVEVYAHAVAVTPSGGERVRVEAGQGLRFSAQGVQAARAADPNGEAFTRGVLVAQDWPLPRLLAELSRHTPLALTADAGLEALHVSGTYRLDDVPGALVTLTALWPVRVEVRAQGLRLRAR